MDLESARNLGQTAGTTLLLIIVLCMGFYFYLIRLDRTKGSDSVKNWHFAVLLGGGASALASLIIFFYALAQFPTPP
jgi:hypothetical protein